MLFYCSHRALAWVSVDSIKRADMDGTEEIKTLNNAANGAKSLTVDYDRKLYVPRLCSSRSWILCVLSIVINNSQWCLHSMLQILIVRTNLH